MSLEGLLTRGSMPVLEQVLSFTEQRQKVLADNISNIDTVGYKMKDLDAASFNQALNDAVQRRAARGADAPLTMTDSRTLRWDAAGNLTAQAIESENNNILFHDDNNRFIEKQMSLMSQNGLRHNVTAEMLRGKYSLLQQAIRGQM